MKWPHGEPKKVIHTDESKIQGFFLRDYTTECELYRAFYFMVFASFLPRILSNIISFLLASIIYNQSRKKKWLFVVGTFYAYYLAIIVQFIHICISHTYKKMTTDYLYYYTAIISDDREMHARARVSMIQFLHAQLFLIPLEKKKISKKF